MRFSVLRTVLHSDVSTRRACMYVGFMYMYWYVRVSSLREMLCGFSHRAGRARALLTLPFSYLQVLLCHARAWGEEPNVPVRASPTRACIRSDSCECRREDERCRTWRGTCVRHERCMPSASRRARLPPVKPTGAVVPLCCGTLCRKGQINPVVTLE